MRIYNLGSKHRPEGKDVVLPSGQTCQVRANMSLSDLIADGILSPEGLMAEFPEYAPDATATVDESKPVGDQIDLKMDELDYGLMFAKILASRESTDRLWALINRIVCYTVISPKVRPIPADDVVRAASAIYVDYIELDDRAFLFNYALGGPDTVEGFANEVTGSDRG